MDIVPSCRLRDLLEALILILPMQFGDLHSRCSGLAQNIENSHCIAMMEAVNGAKDLNVSVTVPAIEESRSGMYKEFRFGRQKAAHDTYEWTQSERN
uniref:3-hydroxy-3-methylglutaryl-coenzyme A reductase 1 n=1 Tax=Tanacetum cinerariifolium TaxID=118510 RepID=A0A6L2N926_TANCI|nr:3-hydroxy-3-methylglutaryl-coenzyme A reductase 1 [Tanacetum cinerariifolium]